MRNYMDKDFTNNLFKTTLNELLEEELEKAESQEKAEEIIKKFEELDLESIYGKLQTTMARDIANFMREKMYEEIIRFRAEEQEFLARLEQKWNKAFVTSEAMYIMVLESVESYLEYVNQLDEETLKEHYYTFTAMQHIHGRALQEFLEITTLMKNGFADGAYARWRSMYELTMIASFIRKFGESVAEAFIQSSKTDDRYEWARASNLFPQQKKYITFNDIQKNCDIDSGIWRYQYDLANKTVHASPQGTFARMGNMGTHELIPVGRSDFGLTTPAEYSAISLFQITTMFFTIHPSGDSLVAIQYIKAWVNTIREFYFKTHDEVFPEEEKVWDENLLKHDID